MAWIPNWTYACGKTAFHAQTATVNLFMKFRLTRRSPSRFSRNSIIRFLREFADGKSLATKLSLRKEKAQFDSLLNNSAWRKSKRKPPLRKSRRDTCVREGDERRQIFDLYKQQRSDNIWSLRSKIKRQAADASFGNIHLLLSNDGKNYFSAEDKRLILIKDGAKI